MLLKALREEATKTLPIFSTSPKDRRWKCNPCSTLPLMSGILTNQNSKDCTNLLTRPYPSSSASAHTFVNAPTPRLPDAYSGLQFYASSVGAILVIAQTPRAKTSFAPTKKRSHESENRSSTLQVAMKNGNEMFVFHGKAIERHYFHPPWALDDLSL
jgi:hypothetical protein